MVATGESAVLAQKLIAATCAKQGISRGQLTIHADRGASITSRPVALLLADLGVTESHSWPDVSNENPYSEAQFKTLKYWPASPVASARSRPPGRTARIFGWYDNQHCHGGLGRTPPPTSIMAGPQPSRPGGPRPRPRRPRPPRRFVCKPRAPRELPGTSWINLPMEKEATAQ